MRDWEAGRLAPRNSGSREAQRWRGWAPGMRSRRAQHSRHTGSTLRHHLHPTAAQPAAHFISTTSISGAPRPCPRFSPYAVRSKPGVSGQAEMSCGLLAPGISAPTSPPPQLL